MSTGTGQQALASASSSTPQSSEESLGQRASRLTKALENPAQMSTEDLYSALENAQEALVEWQREWMQLQRGAVQGKERETTTTKFRGPRTLQESGHWDRARKLREEREERWNEEESEAPGASNLKALEGRYLKESRRPLFASEGVAAAGAARSPGTFETQQVPAAVLSGSVTQPARRLPIPKELIIDMVDDLAVTTATRHGQRTRKPRTFLEMAVAPARGKRKRAADEGSNAATAAPTTKLATTRETPASSAATPLPPSPAKGKRKPAAADDDNVVSTTPPPPPKKGAMSRATSAAPSRAASPALPPPYHPTARTSSRAASIARSRAGSSAPPHRPITRTSSRAASTGPLALPLPQSTAADFSSIDAPASPAPKKAWPKPQRPSHRSSCSHRPSFGGFHQDRE
ncbi:hypothetical protein MMC07_001704 [Pseudocyphellaria aurata]|nr:hypothetical protein [Pseudocyphellaria aurata]